MLRVLASVKALFKPSVYCVRTLNTHAYLCVSSFASDDAVGGAVCTLNLEVKTNPETDDSWSQSFSRSAKRRRCAVLLVLP